MVFLDISSVQMVGLVSLKFLLHSVVYVRPIRNADVDNISICRTFKHIILCIKIIRLPILVLLEPYAKSGREVMCDFVHLTYIPSFELINLKSVNFSNTYGLLRFYFMIKETKKM